MNKKLMGSSLGESESLPEKENWFKATVAHDLAHFVVRAHDETQAWDRMRFYCKETYDLFHINTDSFNESNSLSSLEGAELTFYQRGSAAWVVGINVALVRLAEAHLHIPLQQEKRPESTPLTLF